MTANTLIGTWRVLSFTRWDKEGAASQPLGLEPAGCAMFDAAGPILSLSVAMLIGRTSDPRANAAV